MSSVTRPRGRLPARVYWTRRLLVLALALALVGGIAHLLGAGGGGGPSARTVGASLPSGSARETPGSGPAAGRTASNRATTTTKPKQARQTGQTRSPTRSTGSSPSKTPLALPTGPCRDDDIVVAPAVKGTAYAGHQVVFRLRLSTLTSPACTWRFSPSTVVVRLTSGSDRIWSTQDCPSAIQRQDVVVRKDHPSPVLLTWDGQRSDGSCSKSTPWALPGYYHVAAAAIGANPVDQQFELYAPPPPTITPKPKHKHRASGSPSPTSGRSG